MSRDLNAMKQQNEAAQSNGRVPWASIPTGDSYWRLVAPGNWPTSFLSVARHRFGANPNRGNKPFLPYCPVSIQKGRCPFCEARAQQMAQGRPDAAKLLDQEQEALAWAIQVNPVTEPATGQVTYAPASQVSKMTLKWPVRDAIMTYLQPPYNTDLADPERGVVIHIKKTGSGLQSKYTCNVLSGYPGTQDPIDPALWSHLGKFDNIVDSGIVEVLPIEKLEYLLYNGLLPPMEQQGVQQFQAPPATAPGLPQEAPPFAQPQPVPQAQVAQQLVHPNPTAPAPSTLVAPAVPPPSGGPPVPPWAAPPAPGVPGPTVGAPPALAGSPEPSGHAVVAAPMVPAATPSPSPGAVAAPTPLPTAEVGSIAAESQAALDALEAFSDDQQDG